MISVKIKRTRTAKDYIILGIALALLVGGGYLLITIFSPFFATQFIDPKNNETTKVLQKTTDEFHPENRIYIPAINVNIPYKTGGAEVLELTAWWRKPENGNPKEGGNFIVAAHRFQIGPTPQRTINNSPFYNINKLKVGDSITVDYDGKRYEYSIYDIYKVKPDAVEIEERTDQPRLTLYSCSLGGSFDKREVIIAVPK